MSFIWPNLLVAVALVPLGVLLYPAMEGRRRDAMTRAGFGLGQGTIRRPLGVRGRLPVRF